MLTDIQNREDIIRLVDVFYDQVVEDEQLGYLFNDVAKVNWATHKPIMYDFWESLLLESSHYGRNAMQPHLNLHQRSPLLPAHFAQWEKLFIATVDSLFVGDIANKAKSRALSISTVMQTRISLMGQHFVNITLPNAQE